jgi:hypothetical protein
MLALVESRNAKIDAQRRLTACLERAWGSRETRVVVWRIVRALCNWRQYTAKAHERIVKNAYIDIGIEIRGVLTELYEVKTNCDRQTLYSAIGQVVVHGEFQSGTSQRFLVLPSGEQISDDIDRALTRAGISVIRFELADDEIRIVE